MANNRGLRMVDRWIDGVVDPSILQDRS